MPVTRVCLVVGARPQFIKAAELIHGGGRVDLDYTLVHTGQHYDPGLSDVFFDELDIPAPQINLNVGSGSHARQTGEIMSRFERYLFDTGFPDWLVVFGDTNSTLAASITAAKLGVPVAHVEAGLRSFDRTMPEELNRVVTDRISDLLFCPSDLAVTNLANEGIVRGVHNTGDIMFDSVVRHNSAIAQRTRQISSRMGSDPWVLATIHRPANTDKPDGLDAALACLEAAGMPVVWPVHPRARSRLESNGTKVPDNVRLVDPMGYLTMLAHIGAATRVLTDSGGVQKEAFWLSTPCITLRDTTEWPETVAQGWNVLVGNDPEAVREAVDRPTPVDQANPYGNGDSAQRMAALLILSENRAP